MCTSKISEINGKNSKSRKKNHNKVTASRKTTRRLAQEPQEEGEQLFE